VTTQTVVGQGDTEDGFNRTADAIVLQLQDNYTGSNNGHGRRLKFALPLPGIYDTNAPGTQRADNIINKNGGVTILFRFRVMPGTLMEPDFGIGESVYASDIVGLDCSDGDDDRAGLAVGNDMARWTTDNDTKSTPNLVGDMTAGFRTFWMVFEPGVNLDNGRARFTWMARHRRLPRRWAAPAMRVPTGRSPVSLMVTRA
jgi:hypothetical protein